MYTSSFLDKMNYKWLYGAFENQAQVSKGNLNFPSNAQGPGKPSREYLRQYLRKVYQNNNKNFLPVLRYSTIPDLSFESFKFWPVNHTLHSELMSKDTLFLWI